MNENEIQLKVQALVDGELTGREAEALQQRINDDAKLQQLHARLTQMRGLIADSELPRPLPESGDFYWNKIAETIEHEKRAGNGPHRPRRPVDGCCAGSHRWRVSRRSCCYSPFSSPQHRTWGSPSTATTNWRCLTTRLT